MMMSAVDMEVGKTGTIVSVSGGSRVKGRLSSLGLYPGVSVTKISSTFQRGPVTLLRGQSQVAIGYGQALKVLVEVGN